MWMGCGGGLQTGIFLKFGAYHVGLRGSKGVLQASNENLPVSTKNLQASTKNLPASTEFLQASAGNLPASREMLQAYPTV